MDTRSDSRFSMGVTADDLVRIDELEVPKALASAARHSVTVDLAGTVVKVSFDEFAAAETYRTRYRHMLSDGPVERRAFALAHRPGEIYIWLEGVAAYRFDRFAVRPHVVAFFADAVVTSGVFTSTDDLIALHAGVVCDDRAAAAIIGSSTAGKTTTAIACVRRGLTLLSDEHCVVTSAGVRAFPRALNLRCGSVRLLGGDPAPPSSVDRWLEKHRCYEGNDLGFDELFGALPSPERKPLRAIFALAGTAPQPSITRISPAAMLEHARAGVKMKLEGFAALQSLFTLLQNVECYEVVKGTPDETARAVVRVLAASTREMSSVA